MICKKSIFRFTCIVLLTIVSGNAFSQNPKLPTLAQLKELSMEDLMNIEVTSVSKRPEKLSDVASAIQVITREDILRSAATSVPEALRLAPNLQVTQLNSHHWTISARGFNSTFSNKLLVMIDGRTVYSPLFAGVFWDAQSVLLEDVERIEIISGPGGSLWGANAVNGVINIITKNSKDTQGLFVSAGVGSQLSEIAEARYGGTLGNKVTYRVYGQHQGRKPTLLENGNDNTDNWKMSQGGFQIDYNNADIDVLSLQGNFYQGLEYNPPNSSSIDGQNVMGRWTHIFSEKSELSIQAYFDRTWRRDVPNVIDEELETYDIEIEHRFKASKSHNIMWGAGYRLMDDETWNRTQFVGFLPNDRGMNLFSSFVQDEITIIPGQLNLTVGTKVQHTNFTGFEVQPSARLAWAPGQHQTVWSAVSRAIRAPSRIDVDYHIPAYTVPPDLPSVAGGPNFISEKVVAYELGYRLQPSSNISLSIAAFYNSYDDLYSVEALPGTLTFQIQNGVKGHSRGSELSGHFQINPRWRIRGGYTYFTKKLKNKPGNLSSPSALASLGTDAESQAVLQSILNLPGNFQLDLSSRFTGRLSKTDYGPEIPSYTALNARIAWQSNGLELSISGQNLLKESHVEVGNKLIQRNIYGKITWRW